MRKSLNGVSSVASRNPSCGSCGESEPEDGTLDASCRTPDHHDDTLGGSYGALDSGDGTRGDYDSVSDPCVSMPGGTGGDAKKVKALLRFPPSHVARPVTYHLVKDYNLKINILHAQISSSSVGRLVMDIEGSEENLALALDFLKGEGVECELLNGSVAWNDAVCVHCGACTAVCPAKALTMDTESWALIFDKAKCLVCHACVNACPVGAMDISI